MLQPIKCKEKKNYQSAEFNKTSHIFYLDVLNG